MKVSKLFEAFTKTTTKIKNYTVTTYWDNRQQIWRTEIKDENEYEVEDPRPDAAFMVIPTEYSGTREGAKMNHEEYVKLAHSLK
jgi:hypothetical protein